jgi:DNA-nicking Smr family endonuclease
MNSDKKTADDLNFRKAMADVTPLKSHDRIEPVPKKPPAKAIQREKDDQLVLQELLEDNGAITELETGEELLFLRPGYKKAILRRLRRGQFSVADTIDLHHMDVATARQVLLDFLTQSADRQLGCVRVIHGKGLRSRNLPLIKIMTNRILRKYPQVIAFASCRPVDGGTGAADVLLASTQGSLR